MRKILGKDPSVEKVKTTVAQERNSEMPKNMWPKELQVADAKGDVVKSRRRTDDGADAELRAAHAGLARAEMLPDRPRS